MSTVVTTSVRAFPKLACRYITGNAALVLLQGKGDREGAGRTRQRKNGTSEKLAAGRTVVMAMRPGLEKMLPDSVEEGTSLAVIARKLLRKSSRGNDLLHVAVSCSPHSDYYFGSYRKFDAAPCGICPFSVTLIRRKSPTT